MGSHVVRVAMGAGKMYTSVKAAAYCGAYPTRERSVALFPRVKKQRKRHPGVSLNPQTTPRPHTHQWTYTPLSQLLPLGSGCGRVNLHGFVITTLLISVAKRTNKR